MKAHITKTIQISVLVIGAALVYGNGKVGPLTTLFNVGPGGANFTWQADNLDRTHYIERAESLIEADWQVVETVDTPVETNTFTDVNLPASGSGFYRIRHAQ